ncbi:sulfite exporter TauE/SafE family protein [Pseudomonas sp. CCI3.2]|uniref:sulfite exporter TauE/SafE family protein n=1 Tax=unclassified Pseudomonas TaxID=196821 RepID=UPI002AC8F29E|nr:MULTISPECIES: sulfite exporter TauE/SafE family protein [unclassified Pseudomonas]MEB0077674.1 sulfite exporter TauE/SafE family protein [Pseudomonas sp. MH10out]MEB0093890.1 sulfite exporter TauE/SafE family protein [Pseudomonas sp. CCI4.2]MEB0101332.1 sulfite exporter TauE/SafE family protein [Pseudomonas sp. CCI3.2]MEB0131439.1 sulfite exporter TauE/SafE family protein [Pseudomonas sp. CCI2.4]MEB0158449.1 sulfite exporter TauE/SafE family protein [Pseudomonas sp. AH2 (2023)]
MMEHDLLGVALGAVIGAILALTGAGGGILAVPVLVFGLGLSMVQAAPVGLLAVGLAAAVGAILGLRQGVVRYRAAAFISVMGILAAPVGLYIAHRLPNQPLALVFAAVLLYASIRMLRKANREIHQGAPAPRAAALPCVLNPLQGRLRWTLPCARALTFTGLLCGLLSGLLGVGGGFVIIPALTRYSNLEMKSVVATSLAVIALVSIGSVTTAALTGVMYWEAGVPFALGAVVGLIGGRQIAHRLAGPRLQQAFALVGMIASLMLATSALGMKI